MDNKFDAKLQEYNSKLAVQGYRNYWVLRAEIDRIITEFAQEQARMEYLAGRLGYNKVNKKLRAQIDKKIQYAESPHALGYEHWKESVK